MDITKPSGRRLGRSLLGAALCLAGLTACSSASERAARANNEYQAAMAVGDLPGARNALLKAVQAKDDVPAYWSALGQTQVALGRYADAYYAYSRAVELDRSNVEAMQTLADISLASGRPDEAERLADQIELLQPGTIGPLLTKGYVALRRRNYPEAVKRAEAVLAINPDVGTATLLKGRALDGLGRSDDAIVLLEPLAAAQKPDAGTLQTLLGIYKRRNDKAGILRTRERFTALFPSDATRALDYAEALYAAGRAGQARDATLELVRREPSSETLAKTLRLWLRYAPRDQALSDARSLEVPATGPQRINLARFFIEAGEPAEARALLQSIAVLPVTAQNTDALAVTAHALDAEGRDDDAAKVFDAVLAFDATNILALRGRTDLYLSTGRAATAMADAQRLTAENPTSPEDRLRLAQAYLRQGNTRFAESTYWEAFGDIKADPLLYASLRAYLLRTGKKASIASLDRQYRKQQQDLMDRL